MLILATFTLFTSATLLVILRVLNRRIVWHWLAALAGGLIALVFVLLARLNAPHTNTLLVWYFPGILSESLSLRLDTISWPFSLAVAILPPAVVLTVFVRRSPLYWRSWAGTLLMTAIGLVAVCAGDALTLMFAWAALDLLEVVVLFAQGRQGDLSRNIALAFAGRALGNGMVMLAILVDGRSFNLDAISAVAAPYLLFAAGLRLGVLPFNAPYYFDEVVIRRGLGTALRLIPAASGLMLLTRLAVVGVSTRGWVTPEFPMQSVLLGVAAVSALVGAISWATSKDEMAGRLFWALGTGAMATAAAILGLPEACLAWGCACLFSGTLIFLHSIRGRGLWLLPLLSALAFSGLPFTPGWQTAALYQAELPWLAIFALAHGSLLVGFVRHTLRSDQGFDPSQRWSGLLYWGALILLLASQFLVGYLIPRPEIGAAWWGGALSVAVASGLGAAALLARRLGWRLPLQGASWFRRFFALNWLYRSIEVLYRLGERVLALISHLLEGEGGLLWVFILVGMLVTVFLSMGGALGR